MFTHASFFPYFFCNQTEFEPRKLKYHRIKTNKTQNRISKPNEPRNFQKTREIKTTLTSERNVGLGRFQNEKQDQILHYQNDILHIAKRKRRSRRTNRNNYDLKTESEKMKRHKTMKNKNTRT